MNDNLCAEAGYVSLNKAGETCAATGGNGG
jgi:hypothetical protein